MKTKQTVIRRKADADAAQLLSTCTPTELTTVGYMLGMSNLGLDEMDRPENVAESDEMYDAMMEEINDWCARLRKPREKWGWCNDLPQLVAKAKAMCARRVR